MEQQYHTEYMEQQPQPKPEFPMKWHKFMIYFSLWAGAVISLVNAWIYFTGSHYGDASDARMVYAFYKGLKPVDVLFGILMLASAVAYIVARFKLAKLQRSGVKMVVALPVIMAVLSIGYILAASGVTGLSVGELMDSSSVGSLVGAIALAFYNKRYYAERDAILVD